ncbi:M20/M25/M40 family metallo-hydrolase [Compostimonas suwonensis]|uniref:Carboxypeptidase PM20D1 n=1 Tax=Compostimonas suwonensis TaxID=1048394 RepID=A0A2M9BVP8_9MICO|nr:M20/M25/M40 family metallo-hydrolase [Compostimonas suwonensis]PJJ62028.1 carboxypeptidase PM20D1 [Compostimonas suwonensis]
MTQRRRPIRTGPDAATHIGRAGPARLVLGVVAVGAVALGALVGTVVARALAAGRPRAASPARHEASSPARSLPLSAARPGSAERLSRMVRIPTVWLTSDDDPEPFERFEALLAEEYPLVHSRLEREKITPFGILYRWRGLSESDPLVLMAHYDVVPAEPHDWADDPFSGAVRENAVWGRGTLDDKGHLLVVLEAVENLLADGFTPAHDVYVSLGGNEERYGTAAQRIAAEFSRRDIRPWLVLDEGGAIIDSPFPGITVPLAMVGVAEKGVATIRLQTRGGGGHASAPPAVTATTRLSRAVLRLGTSPFAVALPRPTHDMLTGFAPISPFAYRLAFANMGLFSRPVARLLAARGGETEAMTRTTVAVTMLEAGTAPNVLPAAASATLNVRIAIGETVDTVVTTLRAAIGDPAVEIVVLEESDPTPVSSSVNEQFALISEAVTASYPGTVSAPYVVNAATDSRHFHRFVPAVYRFSPFVMSAEQRASVHGVDEHVTIDSLERGERFVQTLIRSLPERRAAAASE